MQSRGRKLLAWTEVGRVRVRVRGRGRGRGRGVRYSSPNPRSFIWGSAGCEKSKGGNPGSPDILTRRWSCCLAKLPEATVTRWRAWKKKKAMKIQWNRVSEIAFEVMEIQKTKRRFKSRWQAWHGDQTMKGNVFKTMPTFDRVSLKRKKIRNRGN